MIAEFSVGTRRIAPDAPTFVIAELSGNHNGDLGRALALIRAAQAAGVDAVKLQTYTADTITIDAPQPWFRLDEGPWAGRTLHDLYHEASTPWAWHAELFAEAARVGLPCFSTPFDPTSVDFLEQLGCPIYKVASFEVVDLPLLMRIGATRKPVIMSTGLASLTEIALAVETLRAAGAPSVALLTCVSAYPAQPADMHLANIPVLAATFSCVAGLSDHSLSPAAAVASVALGGRIIEKHLCLRRADGGPDGGFSLEPEEFASMVRLVREAEAACRGAVQFGAGAADAGNVVFRKSLFIVRDLPAGHVLTTADVRSIRPGNGLAPRFMPHVVGRALRHAVVRGTPVAWELLA